jgi:hypothetical protein
MKTVVEVHRRRPLQLEVCPYPTLPPYGMIRTIISSSFNDIDLSHIMLADCCVRRRRGRGTMVAVGQLQPPW